MPRIFAAKPANPAAPELDTSIRFRRKQMQYEFRPPRSVHGHHHHCVTRSRANRQLTKEAEEELFAADKFFSRTGAHPVYEWLEKQGKHVARFDRHKRARWR